MYTYKVRLHPNNKQATSMKNLMNKCIECNHIIYDILDAFIKTNKRDEFGKYEKEFIKCSDLRKQFTILKKELDQKAIKQTHNMTLKEKRDNHLSVLFCDVSNDALKQTIKDTYNSFMRFIKGVSGYPVKKKYNSPVKSFYVDPYKIKFTDKLVKLEKLTNETKQSRKVINWVRLAEKDRIPTNCTYYNPRITFDGKYFFLTVSVDDSHRPIKSKKTTNETIGIDLNISTINLSDGREYVTLNKDKRIKKITKKLKRIQRSSSRKYIQAKELNKKLRDSYNFIKDKKAIRKTYRKLKNIRDSHNDDIINDIFLHPPKKIVIETLDVKSMAQNKKISSKLQITGFRLFINKLKDRILKYKTILIEADKYYPSSKLCSSCGNKKIDLKLSDRVYKCQKCGMVIQRDLNAAINLAKFQ